MAIKKSELYSSLWAGCDELRGGMDASQYKDYVLVLLFIKYVSDKYDGVPFAPITIPTGSSFKDMVALKGKTTIGDDINKKIIAPLADANKLSDMPDFNDANKLGSGKDMVDRLSNLIAIFEKKELDFSKNRADGDDILGDAYEYLMMHFATESGKSKGQFYTPAEVSKIIAKIIGINKENTRAETTVYDPTCGSGSLLIKVGDEAEKSISLFGQEKDSATSGLARMNMILHDNPTAVIMQGNTLANPLFLDTNSDLKLFDYVVANPPFSDKRWSNGIDPANDPYNRFNIFGEPPDKNGDYAFLLHIIRSLKSKGKGACILPHGVLFRGNAEATIRENLIKKGYIKGIIGLPANLFYGTGIPACIVVIDKENADSRKGIFMIDAGKGFVKDGNKNRLQEKDIHKIVDVFNKQIEVEKFSRMVSIDEIEKNEFNLNIPRYINSQEPEDVQDIEAHLLGDIPNDDISALQKYWDVYPTLKKDLFATSPRPAYSKLKCGTDEIKQLIFNHPEFTKFSKDMDAIFGEWKTRNTQLLKALATGFKPKELIHQIAEDLLNTYTNKKLIDRYDTYQHLMTYWAEVMQDDSYIVSADGWKAETYRILETNKKTQKVTDKGWTCDLVPKTLVIDHFFSVEKKTLEDLVAEGETLAAQLTEMEEEHSVEDGYFADLDKVNKANIQSRLKELKGVVDAKDEVKILNEYLELTTKQSDIKSQVKELEVALDKKLIAKYQMLTEAEVKALVVDDKWMRSIEIAIKTQMDQISQNLTKRIKELAERYDKPLPLQIKDVTLLEDKVADHLKQMGYVWK